MKKTFLFLIIAIVSNIAFGQSFGVPRITTKNAQDIPIELSSLKISVFVVDNIATTTFEMDFYNANSRIMEGELNFPLPNGVTVSRFALDVNGEMREGVVVDKEQATLAYEAVVRRRIDPGVAEMTKGNNFKTRVYPIPPKGYKKAIIAFDQELDSDDKNYLYQLPLNISNVLKNFSVDVEIVSNKPNPVKNRPDFIDLTFEKAQDSYVSKFKKTNVIIDSQLEFSIPKSKKIDKVNTYKGSVTSDNYFYVHLNLKPEQRTKIKPKEITIVWDESSSAKNRDIDKELAFLTDYFKWIGKGKIQLITFSNTIHRVESYPIVDGKSLELLKILKDIQYDGATNLCAVDFARMDSDETLLFTDGISNFGGTCEPKFLKPVLAINSANISNHHLLEHYASLSNGIYLNLFEQSISKAIGLATHQQKQFLNATYDGNKIKDFQTNISHIVTDSFSCSGILEGESSEMTLNFGFGNEVTESHTVKIDNSKRMDHAIGERLWAQKKLQRLMIDEDSKVIREHGKKFNLVTPNTSFIVLEEVWDYVQYEIVPPEHLQKQYFEMLNRKNQWKSSDRNDRLQRLCNHYKNDKYWYDDIIIIEDEEEILEEEIPIVQMQTSPPPPPPVAPEVIEIVADDDDFIESTEVVEIITDDMETIDYYSKSEKKLEATYINELKAVELDKLYLTYLALKPKYENSVSFYFNVATYLYEKDLIDEAVRVISNLAELELENTELLRSLGRKLMEFHCLDDALAIFQEVERIRSFEPQTYYDIGMVYQEKKEHQKAIEALYHIVDNEWDPSMNSRFRDMNNIALRDINSIISVHFDRLDTSFIEECFIVEKPLDIRVVLDWDMNETDVDLYVTDPNKEQCSFRNKKTKLGGRLSYDVREGYGPEEFRLENAIDGKYIIQANFFGSRKQTAVDYPATIRAFVYTKFSTKEEEMKMYTLQLEPSNKGRFTIAEIDFEK